MYDMAKMKCKHKLFFKLLIVLLSYLINCIPSDLEHKDINVFFLPSPSPLKHNKLSSFHLCVPPQ